MHVCGVEREKAREVRGLEREADLLIRHRNTKGIGYKEREKREGEDFVRIVCG